RGGHGLARIIDRIDLRPLLQQPKWIVGFSDITVLHAALTAMGVCSLHAPMCKGLAGDCPEAELEQLRQVLFEHRAPTLELPLLNKLPEQVGHRIEGRIAGGNLSVIYGLRATPYDVIPDGSILFLEDLNEELYHIDRMFNNLRLGGVLQRINGLILGQFTDLGKDDSFGDGLYDIVRRATEGCRYPIVCGFPAGHIPAHSPLVIGANASLSVQENDSCLFKCHL
ncbi:MAG: LD-carboxypeptidase, partial [Paludibacteraceae bacterium]|nr:LD-carboxypeptidase [Paludibacteraceae bacterium]